MTRRLQRIPYEVRRIRGLHAARRLTFITLCRRLYWVFVRGHEYEICHRCGTAVNHGIGETYWLASESLWKRVNGDVAGIQCASCFTRSAYAAGTRVWWLAVEGHAPSRGPAPYPHAWAGDERCPTFEQVEFEEGQPLF